MTPDWPEPRAGTPGRGRRCLLAHDRPVAILLATLLAISLAQGVLLGQMATAERVEAPGWWPTKGTAARQEYAGPDACAACHTSRAASQQLTAMAGTARRADDSRILSGSTPLSVRLGGFSYTIARGGQAPTYTVSDGTRSVSAALAWAFGVGKVGQTYLFERDGGLHEARVSYYGGPQTLDVTPTRGLATPASVEEAMGRTVPETEARRCFSCHTTAATAARRFDPGALMPGVTCEACHGPGRQHASAMARSGTGAPAAPGATIMNPQHLDPVDSVDFCGACHATFWDVKLADERGLAALRSQPYRLQSSKCWGEGDARLTCVACHDPHKPLERTARPYDARCLSCHAPGAARAAAGREAKACAVATAECVTCHMPKYEVPEMHARFTDHLIRVVRGGRPQ